MTVLLRFLPEAKATRDDWRVSNAGRARPMEEALGRIRAGEGEEVSEYDPMYKAYLIAVWSPGLGENDLIAWRMTEDGRALIIWYGRSKM